MTLIEIMVVVLIIAIALVGVGWGIGAVTKTKLRSGSVKVAAAVKFAYSRSVSQGTTVRGLIDVEEATLSIQEAHGRVTLARADDPRRIDSEEDDTSGVDPWAAAQERLSKTLEPSFGQSPFHPIRDADGEAIDRYQDVPIGDGIQVLRMILPHEPNPRESGEGAIYFFPGGMTQHAVVQLTDGSDTVYSVEVHPLTGRPTVHDFAFEPEPISDSASDEERSEVRDPG